MKNYSKLISENDKKSILEMHNSFKEQLNEQLSVSTGGVGIPPKVKTTIDLLKKLNEKYDIVVALQPDHPDREHSFDFCIDYFITNNYDDLITIEPNFKRSGSVRVFKYDFLIKGSVSYRIGTLKDSATDIHYQEDLEKARNKMTNE